MKKLIMVATAVACFASASAFADGFVCQTIEKDLNVKVYNNTLPVLGTRTAAVMVLSDPAIQAGRKTIARFSDVNGTLGNISTIYQANVDHRFNDSGRKGELVLDTKLGELKTINVIIDFSYASPVAEGEELKGTLIANKRNSDVIERSLSCTRYLKN